VRSSSSTSSGHASNSRFFVRPHAATPRTNGMNRRLFLGGLRPPRPSRGWGNGETRFPHSPARGLCPHLPAGGGVGQPGCPIPLRAGCALPHPPAGGGMGKPGFPTPARGLCPPTPSHWAGGWGNPVAPFPCGAGAWGNPVAPSPCARAVPAPSRGRGYGGTRFPHFHVSNSTPATFDRRTFHNSLV